MKHAKAAACYLLTFGVIICCSTSTDRKAYAGGADNARQRSQIAKVWLAESANEQPGDEKKTADRARDPRVRGKTPEQLNFEQQVIYNELFWQHMAYQHSGLTALEQGAVRRSILEPAFRDISRLEQDIARQSVHGIILIL